MNCFRKSKKYFHFTDRKGNKKIAKIKPAPEPEDVIWTNLGQSKWSLFKKKLFTFAVTVVILVASFLVTYFLTKLQLHIKPPVVDETVD